MRNYDHTKKDIFEACGLPKGKLEDLCTLGKEMPIQERIRKVAVGVGIIVAFASTLKNDPILAYLATLVSLITTDTKGPTSRMVEVIEACLERTQNSLILPTLEYINEITFRGGIKNEQDTMEN